MKTAILVISFGTSHRDTLEKTIGAVEKKLKYEFQYPCDPDGTGNVVIQGLKKN